MQIWEKLQGIERPKVIARETRIGFLPKDTACSLCAKSVVDKGGVYCGRQAPGQEARGCFAAVCWKCMNKAGKDKIGGIKTSKSEFDSLGRGAWWMHEKCMAPEDKRLYYGEEEEAKPSSAPMNDDDEEDAGKFAWE